LAKWTARLQGSLLRQEPLVEVDPVAGQAAGGPQGLVVLGGGRRPAGGGEGGERHVERPLRYVEIETGDGTGHPHHERRGAPDAGVLGVGGDPVDQGHGAHDVVRGGAEDGHDPEVVRDVGDLHPGREHPPLKELGKPGCEARLHVGHDLATVGDEAEERPDLPVGGQQERFGPLAVGEVHHLVGKELVAEPEGLVPPEAELAPVGTIDNARGGEG